MGQIRERLEAVNVMLMKVCLLGHDFLVTEKHQRFEKLSLKVH